MTGQQIYELASSFLYEIDGEDEDSKRFAVGFINILLQECLNCENSMRLFLSHKISGVLTLHEVFGAYIALTGSDAEWAF